MAEIIKQKTIDEHVYPVWKQIFSKREYEYLTHIINGLIVYGGQVDNIWIQFGKIEQKRVLHIFEPFTTLNYLGYGSPSVVSIAFNDKGEIEFFTGQDNGIGIFSSEMNLESVLKMPKNSSLEIDFWHFVDAIGSSYEEY